MSPMDTTCALALITPSNKILIVHPTGAGYFSAWSLPKGKLDEGETVREAAIRECYEEAGLDVSSRANELVDLGNFAYTKEKRYHLFTLKYGEEIDVKQLNCMATFSDHGKEIVEVDKFQMTTLDNCRMLLNPRQSRIIESVREKLVG